MDQTEIMDGHPSEIERHIGGTLAAATGGNASTRWDMAIQCKFNLCLYLLIESITWESPRFHGLRNHTSEKLRPALKCEIARGAA